MKKIILVFFLITGLSAGAAGTASAESVLYQVFAVFTGVALDATEDGESAIVIYALSLEDMWTDVMPFVASGPENEQVLDTALSANSMGVPMYIVTDDAYLEEGAMPIFEIYTLYKPVEEDGDDDEDSAVESFGQKLTPEIMKDLKPLNNIQNRQ